MVLIFSHLDYFNRINCDFLMRYKEQLLVLIQYILFFWELIRIPQFILLKSSRPLKISTQSHTNLYLSLGFHIFFCFIIVYRSKIVEKIYIFLFSIQIRTFWDQLSKAVNVPFKEGWVGYLLNLNVTFVASPRSWFECQCVKTKLYETPGHLTYNHSHPTWPNYPSEPGILSY